VSSFLARLAARVTEPASGLVPRPRYRFGDRPATVASQPEASARMEESTGSAEFGERGAARRRVSHAPASSAVRIEPSRYGMQTENESTTAVSVADMRIEPEPMHIGRRSHEAPRVSERLLPLNPPVAEEVSGKGAPRGKSDAIGQRSPTLEETKHAAVRKMTTRLESDPTGVLQSRQGERAPRHSVSQTASRAEETSAAVIVHIGRIDVRAVHSPAPTTSPASPKSNVRKPSLQTYLRDREGGRK